MSLIYLNGVDNQDISSSHHSKSNHFVRRQTIKHHYPSSFDHEYASNRSDKVSVEQLNKEVANLKQILAVHLNLIEQQAKQIAAKDQEVITLKEERSFLEKKIHSFETSECKCYAQTNGNNNVGSQTEASSADVKEIVEQVKPTTRRKRTKCQSVDVVKPCEVKTEVRTNDVRVSKVEKVVVRPVQARRSRRKSSVKKCVRSINEEIQTTTEEYYQCPGDFWKVKDIFVLNTEEVVAGCMSNKHENDSSGKKNEFSGLKVEPCGTKIEPCGNKNEDCGRKSEPRGNKSESVCNRIGNRTENDAPVAGVLLQSGTDFPIISDVGRVETVVSSNAIAGTDVSSNPIVNIDRTVVSGNAIVETVVSSNAIAETDVSSNPIVNIDRTETVVSSSSLANIDRTETVVSSGPIVNVRRTETVVSSNPLVNVAVTVPSSNSNTSDNTVVPESAIPIDNTPCKSTASTPNLTSSSSDTMNGRRCSHDDGMKPDVRPSCSADCNQNTDHENSEIKQEIVIKTTDPTYTNCDRDATACKQSNCQHDEYSCKQVWQCKQNLDCKQHTVCKQNPDCKHTDCLDECSITVETPLWRYKEFSPIYDAEGTEDISDESYERFHRKFELQEKKMRRWEEQRYKEMIKRENLLRRDPERTKSVRKVEESNGWTYNPMSIEVIEISEQLPVAAFGVPLPKLRRGEFVSE